MLSNSFAQAWNNIWQSRSAAGSGIITTCVSLVILGSVILVYLNLIGLTHKFFQQYNYSIFIDKQTESIVRDRIIDQIKTISGVRKIKIIPAENAKKDLIESFGESGKVLNSIELPEFPDIIEFSLERRTLLTESEMTTLKSVPGVNEIVSGKETKDQIETFFTISEFVGVFLISLLLVSIILMIHSSIQIAVRMRIEEIEILRILGATTSFIRTPFVIEGILIASMGYLISLGIIYFLYTFVLAGITFNESTYGVDRFANFFTLTQVLITFALIIILGFISSILATNKVFQELKA